MPNYRTEASDVIVLFADLQAGIADVRLTVPTERLRKGVLGLAKLARLLDIPGIVTAVRTPDGEPRIFDEIEEGMGHLPVHLRTTADSFRTRQSRPL